jgi:DNA-binding LacI/PurR family transcriptional regulator
MRIKAPKADGTSPSRDKVEAYRARMRAQGMRPIQIWVPDTRSEAFKAEAQRQCLAVAGSPQAAEDQAFVEALFAGWGEGE